MVAPRRPLDAVEQRVLGCLVEKELSTPGVYPLTLNALVAACNQTTNREPVSTLDAAAVDAALLRLMADPLVWRDRGSRVLRWRQMLDEKVELDRPAKAVLAELLLRGEQTAGELRSRATRMYVFGALGEVEGTLLALADRGLVEELARQAGQKERRWRHLMGSGGGVPGVRHGEAERPADAVADAAIVPTVPAAPASPAPAGAGPGGDDGQVAVPRERSPVPLAPSSRAPALAERVSALERRVEELARVIARFGTE